MVALLAAMAPGLFRLRLDTDGQALAPPDAPAVAADRAARRIFGLRDPLLVVIESAHPDGIFNPDSLDRLRRLTDALAALPGVGRESVESLATEVGGSFLPGTGMPRGLLDPPPRTPEQLAQVRRDVAAVDLFAGTLVSFDRRAAAIVVGLPRPDAGGVSGSGAAGGGGAPAAGSAGDTRAALYHRVAATARPYQTSTDRVSVVGAPAAEALLGEQVLGDLALLLPLALVVITVALWATCGGPWGACLGLLKVGAALIFTFGLIGWCGQPVYLTTAVTPVLLTTVGLCDEIHLLWRYRHRPAGQPPIAALRQSLAELGRPIVLTSVATAAGFLSFLTSPIRPVSSFGLFTGCGALFCLVWAVVATPALVALRPHAIAAAGPPAAACRPPSLLARCATALGARPRWALPLLAALTALSGLGIFRLQVQDSWIANFAPRNPLRQATERIDRRFAGTHVLRAIVTFDPPADQVPAIPAASGPLLAGQAVEALGRFERSLRALPEVGGVSGLAGQLATTAFLWGGRDEDFRRIVDDPAWIYLYTRRIGNVRGQARRRELIDDGFSRTVVTLLLKAANYRQTAGLIAALRRLERQLLAPVHGRVELAGDVAISQAMIPAIVRTQLSSLALAVAGNLLITTLLFRSLRAGLACIAPTAAAVVWTFGVMGWLGIPIGVATSMFCAVTLGIGIDYGIHFFSRFEAAENAGAPHAGRVAAAAAGPSILIDALAISAGFGLLGLSQVPAIRHLGLLVGLALLSACLLTLASSGALLAALPRRAPGVRLPLAQALTGEAE